jgi:hypothetical protein
MIAGCQFMVKFTTSRPISMNIRVRMIFLSGLIPPLSRVHTHLTYGVACTGGLDVMLDVAGSDATFEFEVSAWISLTMSSIYGFTPCFSHLTS